MKTITSHQRRTELNSAIEHHRTHSLSPNVDESSPLQADVPSHRQEVRLPDRPYIQRDQMGLPVSMRRSHNGELQPVHPPIDLLPHAVRVHRGREREVQRGQKRREDLLCDAAPCRVRAVRIRRGSRTGEERRTDLHFRELEASEDRTSATRQERELPCTMTALTCMPARHRGTSSCPAAIG